MLFSSLVYRSGVFFSIAGEPVCGECLRANE